MSLLLAVTAVTGLALAVLPPAPAPQQARDRAKPHAVLDVLEIATDPPGASVIVDGRFADVSPARLMDVECGWHLITVEKAGYATHRRRLHCTPETARVEIPLAPSAKAALRVDTTPAGASVLINGEFRGLTPLRTDLPRGSHELRLRLTDHEDEALQIDVHGGEDLLIERQLVNRIEQYHLNAIAENPERIAPYTDLAHFHFIRGDMERAAYYFSRGLYLSRRPGADPKEAKRHRKEIHKHKRWRTPRLREFTRRMAAYDEKLNAEQPGDRESVNHLVNTHLADGKLDAAVTVLRRATAAFPEDGRLWARRGEVALRLEQLDAALQAYKSATRQQPRDLTIRLKIGHDAERFGFALDRRSRRRLIDFALGHLQEALGFAANDDTRSRIQRLRARLTADLADICVNAGEPAAAAAAGQDAVRFMEDAVRFGWNLPRRASLMLELAELCLRHGRVARARELAAQLASSPEIARDEWLQDRIEKLQNKLQ